MNSRQPESDQPLPTTVHLTASALAAIDAHARAESPNECCGLLVGRAEQSDVLRVERAVATRNVSAEPTQRYLIDPADHFTLLRELRHDGSGVAAIVGAYHSHPATHPIPSPTDLAEAWPNFIYVIASPRASGTGSETRAWTLVDGNFNELPIVISS